MTPARRLRVVQDPPPRPTAFGAYSDPLPASTRSLAGEIEVLAKKFGRLDLMATRRSVEDARTAIPRMRELLARLEWALAEPSEDDIEAALAARKLETR